MDRDLLKMLDHIDPATLDYQEWLSVGMALKTEGYTVEDWENWSAADGKRFHDSECQKKWDGFHGAGKPITGATIIMMAKERGYEIHKDEGRALEWDSYISDEQVIVDHNWLEERELHEPKRWDGKKDLIKYIETLFESTESVGYVVQAFEKDGKFLPKKGNFKRTAGELLELLSNPENDIGSVFGDYNPDVGAWIRFNPLDGKGVKNENVTDFRYALVESDIMELEKQNAILRELELPIACLVHSANKSLHAIVRIEAANYDEYRKRVDYLYTVCKKNGMEIDTQNRNPSRLSRMPGVLRGGKKQYLIDTNIGKKSWAEWYEWIEGINDDLPDPESLDGVWDNLPELASPLIDGVLRQGHKMLIAGPSKAGKSFALIQLTIAIAEGSRWLNWDCAQGKVLYVNLELDRASCLHRFKDVYTAMKLQAKNIENIDIWNLRGKSIPMDKLAPKLIRRAQKKNYIAVIIDPIYKVITGDENSADQMAHFANQFDKICTELGSAVIYCHHHSKGYQGSKRAIDRASGSGVFARDPDCLLDLTELELTEGIESMLENKTAAKTICEFIKKYAPNYYKENVSMDDAESKFQMNNHAQDALNAVQMIELNRELETAKNAGKSISAWRIEGTLREFPRFAPVNLYFRYPVHIVDYSGTLKDLEPEDAKPVWQKKMEKQKPKEKKIEERINEFDEVFDDILKDKGIVTINDLADEMGVSKKTIKRRILENIGYEIQNNGVGKESTVVRK